MIQLHQSDTFLSQQIESLGKNTWQQQIHILHSININHQLVKLINQRNYSAEIANLLASHNPRSKLITTIAEFLISLFSNFSNQLITLANILITSECMIRLLGNGNKVIASSINEVIKCIISNTDYKQRSKTIKYVSFLQEQFLHSKNLYVREKISLYFIFISTSYYYRTKEALNDFERKIIKVGLQDANEKVRKNMKEILQNIMNFQKENMLEDISVKSSKVFRSKSNSKVILTHKNINKQMSQLNRIQNQAKTMNNMSMNTSLINQSIISDHFKSNKLNSQEVVSIEEYQMHLNLLRNNNSWAMIIINYQEIFILISQGILKHFNNDNLYCQTLQLLLPFTAQKRNKMHQSCRKILSVVLLQIKQSNQEKAISYCQEHINAYIQYVLKFQTGEVLLLPIIISLNPLFFIPKMIHTALNIKISKEKLILLDTVISSIDGYFEQQSSKGKISSKINPIVKNLCQIIENCTMKERQLSFAAMAILSHFKNRFPQQVLAILLCQNDKLLSRIIDLASQIDESLKTAVIDYINNLKGQGKKSKQIRSLPSEAALSSSIHQILDKQLNLIRENRVENLSSLGELILSNLVEIKTDEYLKAFKMIEYLDSADLIMEFKILLRQIAKVNNKYYAQALILIIQDLQQQSQADIIYEHHQLFFIEILTVFLCNHREIDQQFYKQIAEGLIQIYRQSKSIKKRNHTIQALTLVEYSCLSATLNDNQLELVETYSKKLHEQAYELI